MAKITTGGRTIEVPDEFVREFIRQIDNPTEEELEERRKSRDRCRQIAASIPMRKRREDTNGET